MAVTMTIAECYIGEQVDFQQVDTTESFGGPIMPKVVQYQLTLLGYDAKNARFLGKIYQPLTNTLEVYELNTLVGVPVFFGGKLYKPTAMTLEYKVQVQIMDV